MKSKAMQSTPRKACKGQGVNKGIRHTKFSPERLIYFLNVITDNEDVTVGWTYNSYGRNKKKMWSFSRKNYLENQQGDEKLTLKWILGNSLWG
jgi:hypothetical protein